MRSISKIVIAGAVASACGYAAAATLVPAQVTPYSLESIQTSGAAYVGYTGQAAGGGATNGNGMVLNLGAPDVATGQRLTLSGAGFGSADRHTQSFTCSADITVNRGSVTFAISSGASGANSIVYAVTASNGNTQNASCVIPSIGFSTASLSSAQNIDISGLVTVTAGGATIDSFTATRIASVSNEYSAAVTTALNAVIDVQSNRLTFAGTPDSTTAFNGGGVADNFVLTLTPTAKTTVGGVYAGTFSVSLTASPDFAFLNDNATNGVCTPGSGSGQATALTAGGPAGTVSVSPTSAGCNVLTAQFAVPFSNLAYTISLGRNATDAVASTASAFAPTTYTAGYSFRNVAGGATLTATNSASTLAAGSWTQNGTTAVLQYVPISATIPLQIIVANTSAIAGSLSFTAYSNGASCTGTLGSVNANSTVTVGSLLRSALLGQAAATSNCPATFTNQEGRAAVSIVSTTPSANTRVHSGFTVTGSTDSRQIIINSTN